MAEPPAANSSSRTLTSDPPAKPSLSQHFAKHRSGAEAPAAPRSSGEGVDAGSAESRGASSLRHPVASGGASAASGRSYNASRSGGWCGGDAPSVGASVRSGDEGTVRSGDEETVRLLTGNERGKMPNPYRKKAQRQQERRRGGDGDDGAAIAKSGHRVSFAEQLFGTTYDSSSSVVGSVVGSITGSLARGSSGVRRKVPRVGSGGSADPSGGAGSPSASLASAVLGRRFPRFGYVRKNAALLSVLALGMMIFVGRTIDLDGALDREETAQEAGRGLGYDASGSGVASDPSGSGGSGGIMDNARAQRIAPPVLGSSAVASSQTEQNASSRRIDWNRVPPHLRGYYSKAFGVDASDPDGRASAGYGPSNAYRQKEDEYERTQFANAQAALAIGSVGREAVLGFRPPTSGRDYRQGAEMNRQFTQEGGGADGLGFDGSLVVAANSAGVVPEGGGGFGGPVLGKEAFAKQEAMQGALGGGPQQHQGLTTNGGQPSPQENAGGFGGAMLSKDAFAQQEAAQTSLRGAAPEQPLTQEIDSEEQMRLAAQEAALSKTATAEDDARKRRQDELAQLRASAGISGSYYPEKPMAPQPVDATSGMGLVDAPPQEEEGPQQSTDAQAAQIESVRQQMNQLVDEAQQKAEFARLQAEGNLRAEAAEKEQREKLEEELRQHNEKIAREQEEMRKREEEQRKREEEASAEQERARQEAAEKALQMEMEKKQQEELERKRQEEIEKVKELDSQPSMAKDLLVKYFKVPFREQSTEIEPPPPPPSEEKQPEPPNADALVDQQQQQPPPEENPAAEALVDQQQQQPPPEEKQQPEPAAEAQVEQQQQQPQPPPEENPEPQPDPPAAEAPPEQQQQRQEPVEQEQRQEVAIIPSLAQAFPGFGEWRNKAASKFHERWSSHSMVDQNEAKKAVPGEPEGFLVEAPKPKPSYRMQVQSGEMGFDHWRQKMRNKMHFELQQDKGKDVPPPPSQNEVKQMVSQKMSEVENAQNAVMSGESSDLETIASLQKELSELLALMGGGG